MSRVRIVLKRRMVNEADCPMKKQYLTINQAAQRLGVSAKTLRRWEEKGILVPKRSIGNQRRYLLSDIEKREKKAFTINEAAARLYVSANTLRRWEAKGIITPKRGLGNQRFYTLSDIQKIEAMHYPTVEEKEPPVVAQTPELRHPELAKRPRGVSGSPTPTSGILNQVQNDKNTDDTSLTKERFFDIASIYTTDVQKDEQVLPQEPVMPTLPLRAPIHADAPIPEKPEKDTVVLVAPKPKIPWHIARPSTQWTVALSSFVGVILVLVAITKYGDPVTLLSSIPHLDISQSITSRSPCSGSASAIRP